mmetsp:Transcript_71708/g.116251  ORF Transcript_71708/g.116251 Transcript_71708/m.116251 type:complete len:245 (+) Transcript_71708:877-1611(+)
MRARRKLVPPLASSTRHRRHSVARIRIRGKVRSVRASTERATAAARWSRSSVPFSTPIRCSSSLLMKTSPGNRLCSNPPKTSQGKPFCTQQTSRTADSMQQLFSQARTHMYKCTRARTRAQWRRLSWLCARRAEKRKRMTQHHAHQTVWLHRSARHSSAPPRVPCHFPRTPSAHLPRHPKKAHRASRARPRAARRSWRHSLFVTRRAPRRWCIKALKSCILCGSRHRLTVLLRRAVLESASHSV